MIYLILFLAYLISGISILAIFIRIHRFWLKIPHVEGTQIIYWTKTGFFFISIGYLANAFSAVSHYFNILDTEILMSVGGSLVIIGLILFMIGCMKSMRFILKIIS